MSEQSWCIAKLFCEFMDQTGIVFGSEAEIDKAQLMFEAGYRAREAERPVTGSLSLNNNTLVG